MLNFSVEIDIISTISDCIILLVYLEVQMNISDSLKREILADIARCNAQTAIKGSETLYTELVSKYSVIDPDFQKGIPKTGKIASFDSEFDFRREIQAIAAKLDMWIKVYSESDKENANPLKDKIVSFIS